MRNNPFSNQALSLSPSIPSPSKCKLIRADKKKSLLTLQHIIIIFTVLKNCISSSRGEKKKQTNKQIKTKKPHIRVWMIQINRYHYVLSRSQITPFTNFSTKKINYSIFKVIIIIYKSFSKNWRGSSILISKYDWFKLTHYVIARFQITPCANLSTKKFNCRPSSTW